MARLVYYQNWSTYQHSLWVGIGWSCPAQKERQKEREGLRRLFILIGGEEAAMRTRRRSDNMRTKQHKQGGVEGDIGGMVMEDENEKENK